MGGQGSGAGLQWRLARGVPGSREAGALQAQLGRPPQISQWRLCEGEGSRRVHVLQVPVMHSVTSLAMP